MVSVMLFFMFIGITFNLMKPTQTPMSLVNSITISNDQDDSRWHHAIRLNDIKLNTSYVELELLPSKSNDSLLRRCQNDVHFNFTKSTQTSMSWLNSITISNDQDDRCQWRINEIPFILNDVKNKSEWNWLRSPMKSNVTLHGNQWRRRGFHRSIL